MLAFAPILMRGDDFDPFQVAIIVISLIGTALGSFVTGIAGALWVLFVGRIVEGEGGPELARAVVTLGDTLGLTAIAEGIETPEQM